MKDLTHNQVLVLDEAHEYGFVRFGSEFVACANVPCEDEDTLAVQGYNGDVKVTVLATRQTRSFGDRPKLRVVEGWVS